MITLEDCGKTITISIPTASYERQQFADVLVTMVIKTPTGTLAIFKSSDYDKHDAIQLFMEAYR
jgi:TATA-box binding protein (TBP) (component of TFIID and TFIIIB)